MNTEHSESDTSDEDYNPNEEKTEIVSEEESNDDSEGAHSDNEENLKKGRKKGKSKPARKRTKRESDEDENKTIKTETRKPEDEKKRVDALWADFMKDTGFKPRSELLKNESKTNTSSEQQQKKPELKKEDKIKITQVFDFAGEEIKVEKEIPVSSDEAKGLVNENSSTSTNSGKKVRKGGLNSVLGQIGKKSKINTLDKTKLDWDQYKKEENIEEELKAYSKSKDGYLERQDFLQRADLRRFEIEKSVRNSLRANRLNNGT
ncbi:craniofacial development protein 1 [Agrilus planipennis]|uniref:Craniofacial development protein 1 n=1 Tax=Agrilus planipennis TaxID=224129 RepID=A0A1W4X4H3_AGRPL|nr:craniofacial development protein 1 [Agrilus planipennis]XP_018330979.1 craniofacial development protein 1 [Agrilus planipennis]